MSSMDSFIVAKLDDIRFYSSTNFKQRHDLKLPINLLKGDTREPNQIIAMQSCQNELYLAVITGKKLIMNE